jgi:hypothetical protein
MVAAGPDARILRSRFEPSLRNPSLRFPGNGILRAETEPPKRAPRSVSSLCRDSTARKYIGQLGGYRQPPGNLRDGANVWWARQDLNFTVESMRCDEKSGFSDPRNRQISLLSVAPLGDVDSAHPCGRQQGRGRLSARRQARALGHADFISPRFRPFTWSRLAGHRTCIDRPGSPQRSSANSAARSLSGSHTMKSSYTAGFPAPSLAVTRTIHPDSAMHAE